MRATHLALFLCCCVLVLAGCQSTESSRPSTAQATRPTSTPSPNTKGAPTGTPQPPMQPTAPVPRCPQLPAAPAGPLPTVAASLYLTDGTMITALNAAGGSKRWSEQFAEENDSITSVAAEGNMVYLVTEDGTVSALDAASGALRWCSRTQQLELSSSAGPIPLLTVAQGMVYVTQHGRFNAVTALDASNGSQRWQKPLGGASLYMFLNVQVDADLVVLTMLQLASTNGAVTSTSTLVALSASNGATRWSFQSQKGPFAPPLTLANGIAYVVEDVGSACPDTYIDAVHEQDGKLLWRAHQEGCGYIWPVSASGLVFTVPTCKCDSHKVYAFDGATGTQRWVATLSEVGSGPLVDAGVVYVVAGSGNGASQLQALQANSGRALWTWPGAYSVLAAANGVVYVSDSISLVALSSVGKLQWQAPDLGAPTLRLTLGL